MMNMEEKYRQLVDAAIKARSFSYAPYSGFKVGAALLSKDGQIFTGCNIENAAYTPTNCAERTAFFKAVSEGVTDFCAIAIIGGSTAVSAAVSDNGSSDDITAYCAPCGVCRQVMMEFCNPKEFVILLAKSSNDYRSYTLAELFPEGFGPDTVTM